MCVIIQFTAAPDFPCSPFFKNLDAAYGNPLYISQDTMTNKIMVTNNKSPGRKAGAYCFHISYPDMCRPYYPGKTHSSP
ncbi:MAG: hypothetical protein D5S03_09560 [Desulfonatronospira sp. MSAO_Bac3]|nr:MAG: hypothetical protein D5S03_09560 [Desulfonatronospira sp. MSAO_Bac3]